MSHSPPSQLQTKVYKEKCNEPHICEERDKERQREREREREKEKCENKAGTDKKAKDKERYRKRKRQRDNTRRIERDKGQAREGEERGK